MCGTCPDRPSSGWRTRKNIQSQTARTYTNKAHKYPPTGEQVLMPEKSKRLQACLTNPF